MCSMDQCLAEALNELHDANLDCVKHDVMGLSKPNINVSSSTLLMMIMVM